MDIPIAYKFEKLRDNNLIAALVSDGNSGLVPILIENYLYCISLNPVRFRENN